MSAKKSSKVEMRDGLPRYVEDDLAYVLQELPRLQPCSIPRFMSTALGVDARPHGSPGPTYARFLAAFRRGQTEGKLVPSGGRKWRVAPDAMARAS